MIIRASDISFHLLSCLSTRIFRTADHLRVVNGLLLYIALLLSIGSDKHTTRLLERLGHVPRIMDVGVRHILELRAPLSYVFPVRIKVPRLLQSIEHQNTTRSYTARDIPATIIRCHVMINKCLLKMVRTVPPILPQILRQVATDDHPATIRHESGGIHFAHQRIDKWQSRLASLPSGDYFLICLPIVIRPVVDAVFEEAFGAESHEPEFKEISPEELVDEDAGRVI